MVIIYPHNDAIAVVSPAALPLEVCCQKEVPYNVPYLIVQETDIPEDPTFFEAWTADFSVPDGHGLGAQRWFIKQYDAETQSLQAEIDAVPEYLTQQAQVRDAAIADAEAVLDGEELDAAIRTANAEYRQQEELTQHLIAHHTARLSELTEMRKVQTDELFRLEGVQL